MMNSLSNRMKWLAGLALLATLTACGGGSEDSSGTTPAPTPTPIPAPAALAPTITTQPASAAMAAGTAVTFSVACGGTAPLSYQWQRDGKDIAGATSASYTLASPDVPDSGVLFAVVVTNAAGSVKSNAAVLTVNAVVIAPTLIVQPQSASTLDGGTATFSVAATGTAPFIYQWKRNGTDIAGATAASYTTPVLALADTGAVYTVTVANATATVPSGSATLTVKPVPPGIITAPATVAVSVGQTVSFSVAADGSAPLSYQWQRNGAAIAGATSTSYTTAATTSADNGAVYSVVVTNAAASVTSSNATLSVATVAVAPTIATAPQSTAVSVGQLASFSATATGTAPLTYQWRRNGVDISGANSASYTTPAVTTTDNSATYSVRVTNSVGALTSVNAVLTVNAAISNLIGRAWATGQLLEKDDNNVAYSAAGIDAAGKAMVIFVKSNGTRQVLYATRGTPNVAGVAPTWTTPVAIDLLAGVPVQVDTSESGTFGVGVGSEVSYVTWSSRAPCTANTYSTVGTCNYFYMARFLASTGVWEAPLLVGDFPNGTWFFSGNDKGDIAFSGPGWLRSGTTSYTSIPTVLWRANGTTTFQRRLFNDAALGVGVRGFDMDDAGNMLLAAEANQNGTTDIVAYRGNIVSGFGAQQVLDTRGASATLRQVEVGSGGQQIVVWSQNNGVNDVLFAAASTSASSPFVVTDLDLSPPTGRLTSLKISDTGDAVFYNLGWPYRKRWSAGAWLAAEALPNGISSFSDSTACSFISNGDFACIDTVGRGVWATYDASRNVFVQSYNLTTPGSSFVLVRIPANVTRYSGNVTQNSGDRDRGQCCAV